jgi:hypothetical protein
VGSRSPAARFVCSHGVTLTLQVATLLAEAGLDQYATFRFRVQWRQVDAGVAAA